MPAHLQQVTMRHNLEAQVIEEARKIGSSLIPEFTPYSKVEFVDKNEFVRQVAESNYNGNESLARRHYLERGAVAFFELLQNKVVCTFKKESPSYKDALAHLVHEREGHGYISSLKACRDYRRLLKKVREGQATERETARCDLAYIALELPDEGFAHWLKGKATKAIKADRKKFGKYGQTRLDALSRLELSSFPPAKKNTGKSVVKKETERETPMDEPVPDLEAAPQDTQKKKAKEAEKNAEAGWKCYDQNSGRGFLLYSAIERKFGESAVPLAAKACLDVPLEEIIDDGLVEFYLEARKKGVQLAENIAVSFGPSYMASRLAAILNAQDANLEAARELANGIDKQSVFKSVAGAYMVHSSESTGF